MTRLGFLLMLGAGVGLAQQVCAPTPIYSVCDIVIDLDEKEAAAHPNPYLTVDLRAELRSPKAKTILVPAFWDGGRRMVIRFSPVDPGTWDFRLSGNLARFQNKLGQVQATASEDAGFIMPANVHHWRMTESLKAHLWVGDTFLGLGTAPDAEAASYIDTRAKLKFTHVRMAVMGKGAFQTAEQPDAGYFQQMDKRILALNKAGMFADLVLFDTPGALLAQFGAWQQREKLIRYLVSRYSAFHITWNIFGEFESHADGRSLLKEIGEQVKKYDGYQHPRSTGTTATSAPALPDRWMNFVTHHDQTTTIGAIEHHVFATPMVNTGFAAESASAEEFRKNLWNATMTGQYPTAITGNSEAKLQAMKAWQEFMARTRYWDLEPHYDVDGGKALSLPDTEYIIYIEKPGPVEVLVAKHGYDVFWVNPITGESTKEKKEFKGERWMGEPPDKSHDWILHLSREGRKEGMLRSYKFESRPSMMQEIEQSPLKAPFEIIEPAVETLSMSKPAKFSVKVKRETRGTREMRYLWTGEVPTEGRGYRVIGIGTDGTLQIPEILAQQFPAVFNIRLYALNAVGKVYAIDRVLRLTK